MIRFKGLTIAILNTTENNGVIMEIYIRKIVNIGYILNIFRSLVARPFNSKKSFSFTSFWKQIMDMEYFYIITACILMIYMWVVELY